MIIYLDASATTKPLDSVVEAIQLYLKEYWQNPSSLYSAGMKIKLDIEEVRNNVAKLINAKDKEIYFTSGATESNNWALQGFERLYSIPNSDDYNVAVITSKIEHGSILDCTEKGLYESIISKINVDKYGFVDLKQLEEALERHRKYNRRILVSIIAANNEIGVLQNLKKISELVHRYGGVFHTDATQWLPHIPIDVEKLGIDMLSASAQKFGGLKGAGFLYIRDGIHIDPLIYGEQERQMRGGTENVIGIIALGEAIKHINYDNDYISDLREYFIFALEDKFGCKVNGDRVQRLPNNINVTFPQNVSGEALLYMLDAAGVFISTGSACNSRNIEPSHVLRAIGLSDDEASRTIRITLSEDITIDEIDKTIEQIDKAIKLLTMEDYDCEL